MRSTIVGNVNIYLKGITYGEALAWETARSGMIDLVQSICIQVGRLPEMRLRNLKSPEVKTANDHFVTAFTTLLDTMFETISEDELEEQTLHYGQPKFSDYIKASSHLPPAPPEPKPEVHA